jgi:hypothetical protein
MTCPTWREACFTGTIWQRRARGPCSLVAMYAGRFRNCVYAEPNRIGSARKKWASQRPRATLRRKIHAAQDALEAEAGVREVEPEVLITGASLLQEGGPLPLFTLQTGVIQAPDLPPTIRLQPPSPCSSYGACQSSAKISCEPMSRVMIG